MRFKITMLFGAIALMLGACSGVGDRAGTAAVDVLTPEQRAQAVQACAVVAAASPLVDGNAAKFHDEVMAACARLAVAR